MKTRASSLHALSLAVLLCAILNADAFYNPTIGRFASRDPLGDQAFFTAHAKGKTDKEKRQLLGESLTPPYRAFRNNAIAVFDALGLSVYVIEIPSSVPGIMHQMVIGDDGNGGRYVIDFGPRGGCCNRITGPGLIGFTHDPGQSAWDYIVANGLHGGIVNAQATSSYVDAQLLQGAQDANMGAAPHYTLILNDCQNWANRWLWQAQQLNNSQPFVLP